MELWIHLDLKCLAPNMQTLMRHITGWAGEGANGILFEWENMFPYAGFEDAVRKDAYTRKEVADILNHCRALGLKTVPLVQTLGHVEWLLSHSSYAGLREFQDTPEQIRACCEKSYPILRSWISEMMEAHHDSPYIHLGADEARRLKDIDRPDCSSLRDGAASVFLRHMRPLFQQVIEAGKRPVIWSDMVLAHPECLDDFPRELVFCDWLYSQTAEHGPSVHAWGMPRVEGARYADVPEEKKKYFEKYWRIDADDFPAGFYQYPYLPFLRDRGFDVIAAPATLCGGHSLAGPRLAEFRANQRGWLNAAERFKGIGAVNTCWAVRGALREATLVGHRAFLVQGKALPLKPEDSAVAAASWRPAAGDEAERIAGIADELAPPADPIFQTAPLFFDTVTRTHRPVPCDKRWPGLAEELAKLSDDDPLVLERMAARERAARAESALKPIANGNEEAFAWLLGAIETGIRADIWLTARKAARGETLPDPEPLLRRIKEQADSVSGFMKDRYLPSEPDIVREDRYEGLLRLLASLSDRS